MAKKSAGEIDKPHESYRWVKLFIYSTREISTFTQLALFEFFDDATSRHKPLPVPHCSNIYGISSSHEGCENLQVDNGADWMDHSLMHGPVEVVFDFGKLTTITSYRMKTGSSSPEADPVSWLLLGAKTEEQWFIIDDILNVEMPAERNALAGKFMLQPPTAENPHKRFLYRLPPEEASRRAIIDKGGRPQNSPTMHTKSSSSTARKFASPPKSTSHKEFQHRPVNSRGTSSGRKNT